LKNINLYDSGEIPPYFRISVKKIAGIRAISMKRSVITVDQDPESVVVVDTTYDSLILERVVEAAHKEPQRPEKFKTKLKHKVGNHYKYPYE
jgi:hypothetical protein